MKTSQNDGEKMLEEVFKLITVCVCEMTGGRPRIMHSMWSPWPGYSVPPSKWSLVWVGTGPAEGKLIEPADRPVLMESD